MIPINERLDQYLAQRQAFGTGLSPSAARPLKAFAAFAVAQGARHVSTDLFMLWKERHGSASQKTWSGRLSLVRTFAIWLHALDPETAVPPQGLIPAIRSRPRPYIYTDEEVADILVAAARLPSRARCGLRAPTCETLFGLLAVTGLRISEALHLDDDDVDVEAAVLQVRQWPAPARHATHPRGQNVHRLAPLRP